MCFEHQGVAPASIFVACTFPPQIVCLHNGCYPKLFRGPDSAHFIFQSVAKLRLRDTVFPALSTDKDTNVVSFTFKGAIKTKYSFA